MSELVITQCEINRLNAELGDNADFQKGAFGFVRDELCFVCVQPVGDSLPPLVENALNEVFPEGKLKFRVNSDEWVRRGDGDFHYLGSTVPGELHWPEDGSPPFYNE